MHVVATAGHVDHGKSTLVLALTGTDPDRWAEEKQRGLTIDLGFAGGSLPSGRDYAIVDVPGHERFIKNMLAGVGAIDACIFVVAATEGWKPQSEEHLRILELLGVEHGLVALTKVGLVDDDLRQLARLELAEHLAGTFLDSAEVVAVDAPSGVGLGGLRLALDRLLAATPRAADRDRPRLWVDRSFAPKGAGTVVTGTLSGGSLAVGDELVVLGHGRSRPGRVRHLQRLGVDIDRLGPGNRVAVNLGGMEHHDVGRGDALVRQGQWHLTSTLDASLTVLASLDRAVSRRGAYLAYVGSGEHAVRIRVLGPSSIGPGATGSVRLHLPHPLPLVSGDRFVLRESGRGETVGGGEVLDADPVLPAGRACPDRSIERMIAERGWVEADRLERLTGESRPPTIGRWIVDPHRLEEALEELRHKVRDAGQPGLDLAALDKRSRALIDHLDDVAVDRGRARPADAADPLAEHPFLTALEAAPFAPPDPTGIDRDELRRLVQRGLVVEQDGFYFAPSAIEAAGRAAAALLAARPDGFTVAEAREALATSRKWAIPLLAHLDANGMTRRRGDLRIAGPRLPRPDEHGPGQHSESHEDTSHSPTNPRS